MLKPTQLPSWVGRLEQAHGMSASELPTNLPLQDEYQKWRTGLPHSSSIIYEQPTFKSISVNHAFLEKFQSQSFSRGPEEIHGHEFVLDFSIPLDHCCSPLVQPYSNTLYSIFPSRWYSWAQDCRLHQVVAVTNHSIGSFAWDIYRCEQKIWFVDLEMHQTLYCWLMRQDPLLAPDQTIFWRMMLKSSEGYLQQERDMIVGLGSTRSALILMLRILYPSEMTESTPSFGRKWAWEYVFRSNSSLYWTDLVRW